MKILTLQITGDNFRAILDGSQKEETRNILPNTAKRYVLETDNGDGTCDLEIVTYDALRLINGRKKDAPELTVEVKGAEVVQLLDEEGKEVTFIDKGEMYFAYNIIYSLGKILESKNV